MIYLIRANKAQNQHKINGKEPYSMDSTGDIRTDKPPLECLTVLLSGK